MTDNVNDASSEPDTVKKSPLTLYDLPVHVLDKVTGQLSLVDCLSLRKVSRDLRRHVDSSDARCETVEFNFDYKEITMDLDNLKLEYRDTEDGGCIVISKRMDTQETKTYRDARNFKEAMISDASTFLSNPKLVIDRFKVYGMKREFVRFLKSLNHRLNVKAIHGSDLKLLAFVQKFLKPETLEEIIFNQVDFYVVNFNETSETNMEILKNPKLKFEEIIFNRYSDARSAIFSEILKSLNSQLNIRSVVVMDEEWIPRILQSLNPEKVNNVKIDGFVELTVAQFNAIAGRKEWRTKMRMLQYRIPEEIGLERLVDFKEIQCFEVGTISFNYELSNENLIKIRDILLKSPHLDLFQLTRLVIENIEQNMNALSTRFESIMIEDPAYDASTRRFSIPNSQDYFQWESNIIHQSIELTIRRVSPK